MRITKSIRPAVPTANVIPPEVRPGRVHDMEYRPTSIFKARVPTPPPPGTVASVAGEWKRAIDRILEAEQPFVSLRRAEATHAARRLGRRHHTIDVKALVAPFGPLQQLPAETIKEILHTLTHLAASSAQASKLEGVTAPLVHHEDPEVRMMVARLLAATLWDGLEQVKTLAQDPVLGVRVVALCTLRTWGYSDQRGAVKPYLCRDFTAWRADHPYPKRSDLPRLYDKHKTHCADRITLGNGDTSDTASYAQAHLNRYLQDEQTRAGTIELLWLVPVDLWTVPALLSLANDRNHKFTVTRTLQKIGTPAALYGAAALGLTDFNGLMTPSFSLGEVDHPVAAQFWLNLREDDANAFEHIGSQGLGYQFHHQAARAFLLRTAVSGKFEGYQARRALALDNRPNQANEFFDIVEKHEPKELYSHLLSWTDVHPALVARFEAWARGHDDESVREHATYALLRSTDVKAFECGLAILRDAKPKERAQLVLAWGLYGTREQQVKAFMPAHEEGT